MTLEEFEDLPKLQEADFHPGTLFIFRLFNDFGLCLIEEVDDKEFSFYIISAMKNFSLNVDTSHKLLISAFLQPAKVEGAARAIGETRLYVKVEP